MLGHHFDDGGGGHCYAPLILHVLNFGAINDQKTSFLLHVKKSFVSLFTTAVTVFIPYNEKY